LRENLSKEMNTIDTNLLKNDISKAFFDFKRAINANRKINVKYSIDTWSVGEIAEHILLGAKVDFSNTQKTERPFDLQVNSIKEFFLDFAQKHESMPILRPEHKDYQLNEILLRLDDFERNLLNVIDKDDLTEECVDDVLLTGWGYLTKYEWIHLHQYHIIRHMNQIVNLKQDVKMKKLQFTVNINADINTVFDKMLGLTSKSTYELWTALFNPTSTYEGSWQKGSKIYFVGIDDNGKKGGLVSEIIENISGKFISIKHNGIFQSGKEILTGLEVKVWAGGIENYSFEEMNGGTLVTVDLDATEEFASQMEKTYPLALGKLKEICELKSKVLSKN
jgi:hypothetical protein